MKRIQDRQCSFELMMYGWRKDQRQNVRARGGAVDSKPDGDLERVFGYGLSSRQKIKR